MPKHPDHSLLECDSLFEVPAQISHLTVQVGYLNKILLHCLSVKSTLMPFSKRVLHCHPPLLHIGAHPFTPRMPMHIIDRGSALIHLET